MLSTIMQLYDFSSSPCRSCAQQYWLKYVSRLIKWFLIKARVWWEQHITFHCFIIGFLLRFLRLWCAEGTIYYFSLASLSWAIRQSVHVICFINWTKRNLFFVIWNMCWQSLLHPFPYFSTWRECKHMDAHKDTDVCTKKTNKGLHWCTLYNVYCFEQLHG